MSGVDNPPAFACASEGGHQAGMTLRDYFAGQALPAIIAAVSAGQHNPGDKLPAGTPMINRIAFDAFGMADAMLAVRTQP